MLPLTQNFYVVSAYAELANDVDRSNDTSSIVLANTIATQLSSADYMNSFENDYDRASVKFDNLGHPGNSFGLSPVTKNSGLSALFYRATLAGGYPAGVETVSVTSPCVNVVAGSEYTISFYRKSNTSTTNGITNNAETAVLTGITDDVSVMQTIKPYSAVVTTVSGSGAWEKDSVVFVSPTTGTRYFTLSGRGTISATETVDVRFDDLKIRQSKLSGLSELSSTSFSVYPNPSNDIVTVTLSDELYNGTIRLMSTEGKVIESREFTNSAAQTFDVKSLNSGVYFFQVGNTTQKVIIK